MVSSPAPTSTDSSAEPSTAASDFRSISSSLYGSAANSALAAAGESTTRRANRCPDLMILRMRFSRSARSSGVNGRATSKS
jgi:hypothetical protein